MIERVVYNLEKIEVIVAAYFATDHPDIAMQVRELVQDAMRELQPAPDAAETVDESDLLCECGHKLSEHKNAKIGTRAGCYHKVGKTFCDCGNSREVILRNYLPRVPQK